MSERLKLLFICCIVGIFLWMIGSAILCLACYKAPNKTAESEIHKEWAQHFGGAQKKAVLIGAVCGLIIGLVTYWLFISGPENAHKVIRPKNYGKMFGLAPVTKADFVVPYKSLPFGLIISMAMVIFIFPHLDNTGTLTLKPIQEIFVFVLIHACVITIATLPISIAIFSKLTGGKRRPQNSQLR